VNNFSHRNTRTVLGYRCRLSSAYTYVQKLISFGTMQLSFERLICAERDRVVLNRLLEKGLGASPTFLLPVKLCQPQDEKRSGHGQILAPRNLAQPVLFFQPERPFHESGCFSLIPSSHKWCFSYGLLRRGILLGFLQRTGLKLPCQGFGCMAAICFPQTRKKLIEETFAVWSILLISQLKQQEDCFQCEQPKRLST